MGPATCGWLKILGAALHADGGNEVRDYGLKHQKEKLSMDHLVGLDVSVKETSVCIVDNTGKIVREVKVASEPQALLAVLKNQGTVCFAPADSGHRSARSACLKPT
jgi:hypothetical protein